jgi:hypothetical protein
MPTAGQTKSSDFSENNAGPASTTATPAEAFTRKPIRKRNMLPAAAERDPNPDPPTHHSPARSPSQPDVKTKPSAQQAPIDDMTSLTSQGGSDVCSSSTCLCRTRGRAGAHQGPNRRDSTSSAGRSAPGWFRTPLVPRGRAKKRTRPESSTSSVKTSVTLDVGERRSVQGDSAPHTWAGKLARVEVGVCNPLCGAKRPAAL